MAVGWIVMTDYAVLIVGAGPTGLMLAGELALAGVDVAIIERRATGDLIGTRALGLQARTIEVLDQRGIADRFLSRGRTCQTTGFASVHLDIGDFPSRHNYGLALVQKHIERLLADWVEERDVPVFRNREVRTLAQDRGGVEIELTCGERLRAEYVVGCDGGRSTVRKTAGIGFPGWDPTMSSILAEVEVTEEPEMGVRHNERGIHAMGRMEEGAPLRILVTERVLNRGDATFGDLRKALIAEYGTDYGVHSPTSIFRFTDGARQAETYRKGRVLLAGDSAHVHSPVGGQGLNTGVQDAVNLGWKLAQVVKGTSPDSLLDSYHAERHPVAARVLRNVLAQGALLRRYDERAKALIESLSELLRMEEPRRRFGGMMSGLDIRYDFGEGHKLLGRRMPDLDLAAGRVYTLLHEARPLLLDFAGTGDLDIAPWADRVRKVAARHDGVWELPVIGEVAAPDAVLVRPDGHVAWVGEGSRQGLDEALATWFGPPA